MAYYFFLNLILSVCTNFLSSFMVSIFFSFYLGCCCFYFVCWICIRIRDEFLLSNFVFSVLLDLQVSREFFFIYIDKELKFFYKTIN